MKSFEFDAVVYDGVELCVECLPEGVDVSDESVSPIFADSTVDHPVICGKCHAEHDYMNVEAPQAEEPEPAPLAEVLDGAFYEADNANAQQGDALHDILAAMDARYGESAVIRAVAAYWRRSPELFVNRLREAGMEVR